MDATTKNASYELESEHSPTTTAKRGRKPKYVHTIILEGINARELYKKFKNGQAATQVAAPMGVVEYAGDQGPGAGHTELVTRKPMNAFLDPKTARLTTFLDYTTYGSLPYRTDLCCWHDHHTFTSSPIGCPVRFVDKALEKHQIATPVATSIHNGAETGSRIKTNCYYLTIGTFCSFPCVLAFINKNKHDLLYRDAKALLHSLYYKLYGTELRIKPASDWQCLKEYGGPLTIEEFRRTFCTCNYVITPDVKRPYMVSVGKHIEERQCQYF